MPRTWGGECPMDAIDPLTSNGCQGGHRSRPWHWALGYCTKAGKYYQGYEPMRTGEGLWSGTRTRDSGVRVCEAHAERLQCIRSYIQSPHGGRATAAVELAMVADAIRAKDGHPARPYHELVQTTELPRDLPCDFMAAEPEWITLKRQRCERLESQNAQLRDRVVELEVAAVVSQLVADVASQSDSE
jgi:hypothetical protein